jgi:serine/threonine-protein kinase
VCEEPVPPPSTAAGAEAARRCGLTLPALRRRLRGDLDSIVGVACRKGPERRYRSAEAMAEDVERHLRGLPLEARRDSRRYRTVRWLARHRWPVAAAGVLLALLLAYAVTITAQAARLRRQIETTERLSGFLASLQSEANPTAGGAARVRRLLDERGQRLVETLRGEPAVRSELQTTMGKVYVFLGLYPQGIAHLEAALAARRALFGGEDRRTMTTAYWLARANHFAGRYAQAGRLYREQLAWRRRHFAPESAEVTESEDNLACLLQSRGEWAPAEARLRDVLRRRERYVEDPVAVAMTRTNLADLLLDQGRAVEAEAEYRRALATFRNRLSAANVVTSLAQAGLGHALALQGRFALAEREIQGALAVRRLSYGDRHPLIAESLRQLGLLRARQGRLAEAKRLLRQAFEMHAAIYDNPYVARAEAEYASVLLASGDEEAAVRHASAALRRLAREGFPAHPFGDLAREILVHAVPSPPPARLRHRSTQGSVNGATPRAGRKAAPGTGRLSGIAMTIIAACNTRRGRL